MHFLYYFAGWSQCTAAERTRVWIANFVVLAILAAGVYVLIRVVKRISQSKRNINIKQVFAIAAILGISVVTLSIAFGVGFAIAPWCS